MATLSAACLLIAFPVEISGRYNLRPYRVSTYPIFLASDLIFSINFLTPGYLEKYISIYSAAKFLLMPSCLLRPKAEIP